MGDLLFRLTSNAITNVSVNISGYQSWEWSRIGMAPLHIVNIRDLVLMKPKLHFIMIHH